MKELTLIRDRLLDTHTEGRLLLDGKELCKTLELPRYNGAESRRCIPTGEYQGASIPYKEYTVYKLLDALDRKGILITAGHALEDNPYNILVGVDFCCRQGKSSLVMDSHRALRTLITKAGHAIALKVCTTDETEDTMVRYKNNSFVDINNAEKEYENWEVPKGCAISINENLARRGIDVLHPVTKKKIQRMLDNCALSGLKVLVLDTLRTEAEQDRLYNQSRMNPPMGPRVTNAKGVEGVHVWGCAVDFCQNIRGQEYADALFFTKVGEIAESVGLEWGGRWKSPDRPHVQDSELIGGTSPKILIEKYGNFEEFKKTW